MPRYQDIFSPETLEKLNQKSAESLRLLLGNKDLMRVMMSSQALLNDIIAAETPYKQQLEDLAVSIVKDMYPTLNDENIEIDAKITSLSDVGRSLDEATPGEKRRRVINAITQGASVASLADFFRIFKSHIDEINPSLYEKYNEIMDQTFGIYDNDNAIAMMLAAVASGQKMAGGSSKIIISEALGIRARAICFPMLVHELIKGYYGILGQRGVKGDKETRQNIVKKVDTLANEPEDIRYGKFIYKAIDNIFQAFADSDDKRVQSFFFQDIYDLGDDEFFSFVENAINQNLTPQQIQWVQDTIQNIIDDLRADDLAASGITEEKRPYKDLKVTKEYIIREFNENIDPIELKWHRDNEDRTIEIVGKTDWKIQLENQLPTSINQPVRIPKGEWHRVIKGNGTLTLKIIKEESTQYTFAGVLITNTSSEDGRPQKDILSDIRAIEGITIVTSKDYDTSGETSAFNNPNYYSIIKVKVDPNPYKTGFTSEDLQNMLKEIRGIKGVKNFKLNQAVEKTTV